MKTLTSLTAMAVVLFAAAGPLQAGMVTIDGSNTVSAADDESLSPGTTYDSDENTSTAIPTNTTISALIGGASSSTTIGYNEVGGQTILGFDMSHARAGGAYSYGYTYGTMQFTALANTVYDLSGTYDLTGDGSVYYRASLYDVTAGYTTLFTNEQYSNSTLNESFTLGQTGGDNSNILNGSLTGSLISGNQYQFNFDAYVYSYNGSGYSANAATGEGNFTLTIGEATTAVPEPTSLALLGLASLGGLGVRWRNRRKAKNAQAAA